jgi:non-specific serine/threonine protein kinase
VVVDNFEHVLEAGPRLAAVLERCPRLTLLVTSRAPPRLYGEHAFPLLPLELPDLSPRASPDQVMLSPAVQLFVARARAASHEFTLTTENATTVASLCARLDGLPLALELAANRIALLPPRALLDHLTSFLSLRTGGPRGVPLRQRTLADAIGWSYDLLSPADRVLFRRLAVFAGGCTIEAAEAVAGDEAGSEVLEGLMSLVEQSLLRAADGGEGLRFTMLETVHEFALGKLRESGEEPAARRAHASHHRALAEMAEPGLKGADQQNWRDRLEADLDNLRAALAWSVRPGLPGAGRGMRSAARRGALVLLVLARAAHRGTALARGGAGRRRREPGASAGPARRGSSGLAAGRLRSVAQPAGGERRQVAGAGNPRGLAEALHLLGHAYFDQRDYEAARRTFEEIRLTYSAVGDSLVGLPLVADLGMVAYHTGEYAEAAAIFGECLTSFRAHGLKDRVADTLGRMGDLARLEGDLERAARLYEESLATWRDLHAIPGVASALHKLGQVDRRRGDLRRARARYHQSLELQRESGNRQGIAECLAGVAGLALASGQPAPAVRLLAASAALLEAIGAPLAPADATDLELDLAASRERIDEARWRAAWDEGRALGLEEAVRAALRVTAETESTPPGTGLTPASPLSRREAEVAALGRRGCTNREVAAALGISVKTAANHVEHIMTKLDLRSRAQVAVWAAERGMGTPAG